MTGVFICDNVIAGQVLFHNQGGKRMSKVFAFIVFALMILIPLLLVISVGRWIYRLVKKLIKTY